MSFRWARATAYGVVALLAVGAVVLTKPLPPRAPAAEFLTVEQATHRWNERNDTLRRNETLASVLARGGVSDLLAREALKAVRSLDFRYLKAGMPVTVRSEENDSMPASITLQLAMDKFLHLKRDSLGWSEQVETIPWQLDTIVVSGVIRTNLYEAMDSAVAGALPRSARERLVVALAEDIFEYRVDMSRDLQVGDRFRVVAQRSTL